MRTIAEFSSPRGSSLGAIAATVGAPHRPIADPENRRSREPWRRLRELQLKLGLTLHHASEWAVFTISHFHALEHGEGGASLVTLHRLTPWDGRVGLCHEREDRVLSSLGPGIRME